MSDSADEDVPLSMTSSRSDCVPKKSVKKNKKKKRKKRKKLRKNKKPAQRRLRYQPPTLHPPHPTLHLPHPRHILVEFTAETLHRLYLRNVKEQVRLNRFSKTVVGIQKKYKLLSKNLKRKP